MNGYARNDRSAAFTHTTEFRRYLWCGTVCGWALFCGLLLHVLTLPQLMDYSRNYAPSFHSPLDLKFYTNALPYLAGVEHHIVAAVLMLAAVAGYGLSHRDWRAWAAIVGGPLFLVVAFQISGNVASPRLFVSLIFPMLIGLSFFIESLWRQKRLVARAAAVIVAVLVVADSAPVFARYYAVGNPGLRELAARLPLDEVFLANVQAGSNVYYFPKSQWEADRRPSSLGFRRCRPPPTFVLWGDDCRRESEPALHHLGIRRRPRSTIGRSPNTPAINVVRVLSSMSEAIDKPVETQRTFTRSLALTERLHRRDPGRRSHVRQGRRSISC